MLIDLQSMLGFGLELPGVFFKHYLFKILKNIFV